MMSATTTRWLALMVVIQLCCLVNGRVGERRKNVEYMGEKDGCTLCDVLVLCCPQFTITLDSSAFTGPLPPITIPTGTIHPRFSSLKG
jgi:hypothetical protein